MSRQITGWMKKDSDLDSLRSHRRYSAFAERLETQLAAAKA